MGLAVQSDVRFNLAMRARRIVTRIVSAAQLVALLVVAGTFVFWLVAVARHEPHHWQDQWLVSASPAFAVLSFARTVWERYIDR